MYLTVSLEYTDLKPTLNTHYQHGTQYALFSRNVQCSKYFLFKKLNLK